MLDYIYDFFGELDWNIAAVALVFYVVLLACVWKFAPSIGTVGITYQLTFTILGLPMSYLIVNAVANK